MPKTKTSTKYNADNIDILEGLPHIRKRPGMYIGGTGTNGLHHLIKEITDNAVDEATNGYCDKIETILNEDGSITITDNGRGIPVDIHPEKQISAARLIFEIPGAGGKFDNVSYKTSGGLHGVGASVVNALSHKMIIIIKKDGYEYTLIYKNQECQGDIKKGKKTKETGTSVTFYPDPQIFPETKFNPTIIIDRLRELSFLNPNILFTFENKITGKKKEFCSKNGLGDFLDYVKGEKDFIGKPININGKNENGTLVDMSFAYTNAYNESLYAFVNNIKTNGGTHDEGFHAGIKDAIDKYIKQSQVKNWQKIKLTQSDMVEGVVAILLVKMTNPEYEGQTKDKLGNPEIREIVKEIVSNAFFKYLCDNKANAKKIMEKILLTAEARESAKKARELVRKKNETKKDNEPIAKLATATDPNPENCELWICEGDSAGGNMKNVRIRRTQAIMPLRGKVFNCEGQPVTKMLDNKEMKNIIRAIGTGIDEDFDIKKCKYGKIIISTDADIDGLHIQLLLLVFFYRHMKGLIDAGMVYIALSPLFKVSTKTTKEYVYNEKDLDKIVKKYSQNQVKIQRYKGLGELQGNELFETTMDPNTRSLLKVVVPDEYVVDRLFSTTMGNKADLKRAFLEEHWEGE